MIAGIHTTFRTGSSTSHFASCVATLIWSAMESLPQPVSYCYCKVMRSVATYSLGLLACSPHNICAYCRRLAETQHMYQDVVVLFAKLVIACRACCRLRLHVCPKCQRFVSFAILASVEPRPAVGRFCACLLGLWDEGFQSHSAFQHP